MSLDWSVADVADWKTKCDNPANPGKMHPIVDALIWGLMGIGIGAITKKNLDEVVRRMTALQGVNGAMLTSSEGSIYVTREDIEQFIGMRTNVTKEAASTFNARIMRLALDTGEQKQRLQEKSAFQMVADMVAEAAKSEG